MFTVTLGEILALGIFGWVNLSIWTYLGIRAYLYRRGEPTGWRFNRHGARAIPGHLSFYPREGTNRREGVVFTPVTLFPLYWKVQRGRSRSDLETAKRAPVWEAVPWAYSYMENSAAWSIMKDIRGESGGQ